MLYFPIYSILKQVLTTSKIVGLEEQEQKRESKGRALAISRDIFRIEKTESFYCQSENKNNDTTLYVTRQMCWFGVHVSTTQ
jgi:hypothetical protein